jgi:carbon storage regulator CsrA
MIIGKEAKMLVITRRSTESLLIGAEIYIEVLSIQGDRVRLGITA